MEEDRYHMSLVFAWGLLLLEVLVTWWESFAFKVWRLMRVINGWAKAAFSKFVAGRPRYWGQWENLILWRPKLGQSCVVKLRQAAACVDTNKDVINQSWLFGLNCAPEAPFQAQESRCWVHINLRLFDKRQVAFVHRVFLPKRSGKTPNMEMLPSSQRGR